MIRWYICGLLFLSFPLLRLSMDRQSKTLEIMRRIGAPKPERIRITGILQSPELASLTLLLPGGNNDSTAAVLKLLGTHSINIRFINKYNDSAGNTSLCLCIDTEFLDAALNLLDANEKTLGIRDFMYHPRVKVISIYPHKERPRIAERLLTTLGVNGIDILSVNNASSVISCVLSTEDVEKALTSLEDAFELP
jgi:aspartokinase